jgi:hypothetical protein
MSGEVVAPSRHQCLAVTLADQFSYRPHLNGGADRVVPCSSGFQRFSQGQAMPGFGLEPNHVTCGEKTAVDKRTYWRSTYGDNQTASQNLETAENAERAAAYRQGREEGAERCGTS